MDLKVGSETYWVDHKKSTDLIHINPVFSHASLGPRELDQKVHLLIQAAGSSFRYSP
jgi:hypothetical protein